MIRIVSLLIIIRLMKNYQTETRKIYHSNSHNNDEHEYGHADEAD